MLDWVQQVIENSIVECQSGQNEGQVYSQRYASLTLVYSDWSILSNEYSGVSCGTRRGLVRYPPVKMKPSPK
jgi:hypothetical protein